MFLNFLLSLNEENLLSLINCRLHFVVFYTICFIQTNIATKKLMMKSHNKFYTQGKWCSRLRTRLLKESCNFPSNFFYYKVMINKTTMLSSFNKTTCSFIIGWLTLKSINYKVLQTTTAWTYFVQVRVFLAPANSFQQFNTHTCVFNTS